MPTETTIKEEKEEIEKPPLERVFPKINVLNDMSPKLGETPKIDTNILNQLAPKPSKTPKLDVKAWDDSYETDTRSDNRQQYCKTHR